MEEDRVSNLVQNDGPANIIINNKTDTNFKPKSPKIIQNVQKSYQDSLIDRENMRIFNMI